MPPEAQDAESAARPDRRYFCTYFDHNYLPQGLAMYHSLRRCCPELRLFVLTLSGEAYARLRALNLPNVTCISMEAFEADDPALLVAKADRSKVEYIFTCTPCLCSYVMRHHPEVKLLTYLDADLYFFSDVQPLFDELGEASIGIIEHGYSSSRYLSYGRFNVGWICFRRDEAGQACIAWWRERCLEWCKDIVEPTRYADQKYLDQWPDLFPGVHIYQHPGANLARWNIKDREVRERDGQLWVNGQPLVFFHFASFKQLSPWLFQTNFATHWVVPSRLVRREIFGRYIAELYHLAGPMLPRGSRSLKLQDIGLGALPRLAEQLLRIARSIAMLDYIVVPDIRRHAAQFARITAGAAAVPERADSLPDTVWFIFADTQGYSGQKEASRLIYENLQSRHVAVELILMPALDRTSHLLGGVFYYLTQIVKASLSVGIAVLSSRPVVHLSLGQTRTALLRDALPLFMIMALRRRKSAIVSLHGSNFMDWTEDSYEARWLRLIMTQACRLTVLGERQLANARRLGISEEKITIVYNTCDSPGLDMPAIEHKQREERGPFRLLHLSSLIDTKGYPTYLEALEILGRTQGRAIEAVLCGNVTLSQFGQRFKSRQAAESWIRARLDVINGGGRVTVRWVPGATGQDKWRLYEEAHAFIFPSLYKVEAQPLVLLEAMSYGCAVISSEVGEIRSQLDDTSAMLLAEPGSEQVAAAIEELMASPDRRLAQVQAARRRYDERFSREIYVRNWAAMLGAANGP